jgi:hypothetical protein
VILRNVQISKPRDGKEYREVWVDWGTKLAGFVVDSVPIFASVEFICESQEEAEELERFCRDRVRLTATRDM